MNPFSPMFISSKIRNTRRTFSSHALSRLRASRSRSMSQRCCPRMHAYPARGACPNGVVTASWARRCEKIWEDVGRLGKIWKDLGSREALGRHGTIWKLGKIEETWEDLERHPMNNRLSFLYVRFSNLDFILPFNHNDCEKLEIDLSTSNQTKWIWNKKGFLQTDIKVSNLKDVQTSLFFENFKIYDIQSKLEGLMNFHYRLGIRDGLGKSLPIMKWGEYYEVL